MSSKWTHPICVECWQMMHNRARPPMVVNCVEICCYCYQITTAGIYVRADPMLLHCKGVHKAMEPSRGIHVTHLMMPGTITSDYQSSSPVAMWIVTLDNGDTAFLSIDLSLLPQFGIDVITALAMTARLQSVSTIPGAEGTQPRPVAQFTERGDGEGLDHAE